MRVDFYHLQKKPAQDVIPELASKVLQSTQKMVILTSSKEQSDFLNSLLWTFKPDSWLPHGNYKTGSPDLQPIWITEKYENPNESKIIMLLDGLTLSDYSDFERCLYLFNGNNEEELKKARLFWTDAKQNNCENHYWQQDSSGKWFEKSL